MNSDHLESTAFGLEVQSALERALARTDCRVDQLVPVRPVALHLPQELPHLGLEPSVDGALQLARFLPIERVQEAEDERPVFGAYSGQRIKDEPEILPAHPA